MLNACILFICLIKYLYSISGTDDESYSIEPGNQNNIDLNNLCSCDLTKNVCDYGCDCDPDCLNFMFNRDYMETFSSKSSSSSYDSINIYSNINNKMDYCNENIKSVDDLYNPLVLAFKILKKGFCLAYDNNRNTNNKNNKDYNNQIDRNELYSSQESLEDTEVFKPINISYRNLISTNIDNFQYMNFNVPIALPSGFCLFGSYRIMKLRDYEVICSYNATEQTRRIIADYYSDSDGSHLRKFIYNYNYYYPSNTEINLNYAIKKVEIFYYQNDISINHYYVNINTDNVNLDFTLIIKFLNDQYDYPKSGNPGYIKGKPLLMGLYKSETREESELNYYDKSNNDIIFPIDTDSEDNCGEVFPIERVNNSIYFDNYFNNKITFEDFVIYRYRRNNRYCFRNTIKQFFSDNGLFRGFGKYGNANIQYSKDWQRLENTLEHRDSYYNVFLLLGIYKPVGTVNNTQFQIYELNSYDYQNDESEYEYFISKLIKPKKVETEWWYARPPGFIRLPKNVMYPFKIGTTDYENK